MDITLERLWRPIGDSLSSQGAPEHQRREMKKAFLTGAHRMLSVLRDEIGGIDTEAEMIQTLEALMVQFEGYVEGGWRRDPEFAPAQPVGEDS